MSLVSLVDLLQTVVELEPKCCEASHLFLILGAYSAKLYAIGKKHQTVALLCRQLFALI